LELFLDSPPGRQAARDAAAGFDMGDGLPEEPLVVLITTNPATSTTLVLGENARVERGDAQQNAQVKFTAESNALHDLLAENYDAGQIARAIEENRLSIAGSPWSLDALIILAGHFGGVYRASLESRQREDLLNTPVPPPAGDWEVPIPRPEDFVGITIPARRAFARANSR
jgi:hypothetical protein